MFLMTVGDILAKVANAGISDEEADTLIEEAASRAADEVRTLARQARQTELDLVDYRRECGERREGTAESNRLAIARQEQEGRDRNKILAEAESVNGPVRRLKYGLPHSS
ncbi:MAG TPA: hypothetical protein PK036_14690 [Geobacteraceae bacterium]|nr:hypothetical protein [Geobacteraceae bacterium]